MDTLSSGHGGGLAQVVERSIRIREAPDRYPDSPDSSGFIYTLAHITLSRDSSSISFRKDPESTSR